MTKKMTLPFYRLEPDGSESCFLVGIDVSLTLAQSRRLIASIRGLFKYLPTHRVTNIPELDGAVIVGPRLAIETPFSSMAVEITHAVGFPEVGRIEHFRRYAVPSGRDPTEFLKTRRDMVTEEIYEELPCSFQVDVAVPPVRVIPLFEEGRAALDHFNTAENLGFNEAKLQRIERIFVRMGRNPTDVALYQLSQMWSNHCWHDLFFLTHFVIDGERRPYTLIELLREPLKALRGTDADNIMIAGSDNASAVEGSTVPVLVAAYPGEPGPYKWVRVTLHALFSAETHNYPDHVAPYPGSATEIGGEIRDQLGAGSVSDILYALQGRILGSIRFPSGYRIPGEFIRGRRYDYPTDKATPVEVAAKSLQGWHDYADAFGKPCTAGFWFTGAIWRPRRNKRGKIIMERVESLKPVGFGFGGGAIQHQHRR
jgi:phosphoribosylformylglycinamidine synthase